MDSWIIAMAEIRGVPAVMYENGAKKAAGAPKIPDGCEARGINVLKLVDALRAYGAQL
jgi:hypothetical protein